jgi:hypothetical protein
MIRTTCALAVVIAAFASAACSSGPVPTAELAQAHSLVDQAEQSGAQQYASADLASARSKLQAADGDAKKDPKRSLDEAQEATADARVALARTNAAKAQAALRDVNAGTRTLQNETDRQQLQNDMQNQTPATAPMPQ